MEVLVAIFVMALGMLALLTLFPLGALRMAQAIQDDRTAQCAQNANSIATMKNVRFDPLVLTPLPTFKTFEDDLGGGFPPDAYGPSNPVMVDPAGFAQSAAAPDPAKGVMWVGGYTSGVPRCTTSFALPSSPSDIRRWFNFLDEYEFERLGSPTKLPGETSFPLTRDYAYSWAYMLQRPKTSDPNVVDCSVMVFRRRPMALTTTLNLREFVYVSSGATKQLFDLNRNIITIDHSATGEPPPIKAGDWILDASVATSGGKRYSHANFYRVVSATEISDTLTEFEVQTPLRGFDARFPQTAPNSGVFIGTAIVFEGLVEVFDRGTGWK